MINRQQLQYNAGTLQSRATATTALLMTLFLLCIEHVRAFANQYHISAHDAMVLASAASSLTRKLSSTYIKAPAARGASGLTSSPVRPEGSSTSLKAWSIPAIAMPSLPTSKELPFHALGSWYSDVDPTTKPPVYDDEYDSSYSFGTPTDDWPSMEFEESNKAVQSNMRRGPLRAIRRVAGRFRDVIAQ